MITEILHSHRQVENHSPHRQVPVDRRAHRKAQMGMTLLVFGSGLWPALGNGMRLPDQSAAATFRGEAFAATADDPSAVYYNPAGLTQLRGHNFSMGAYLLSFTTTYRSPEGHEVDSVAATHVLPSLYYAYATEQSPVAVGLGAYAPFGLGVKWPEDSGFRSIALEAELSYLTANPVVAWRISPELSIGAGMTVNHARLELEQGLSRTPHADQFRFGGEGTSLGWNLGLLWQPHVQHSFGLSYGSAARSELTGHTSLMMQPTRFTQTQDAKASLPFPQHLTLGWSFRPTPDWNVEFNFDWTDWSPIDSITIHQATPIPPLVLNWLPSRYYKFGVTRYLGSGYEASLGCLYNEGSVPDSSFNPAIPDQDRLFASAGVRHRGARMSWALGYQFGYGGTREVRGSPISLAGETADGRYEFVSHALTFLVGYHF